MNDSQKQRSDMRVVMAAHTRKDALLVGAFLRDVGITSVVCDDLEAVCTELEYGVGALLLPEELLTSKDTQHLRQILHHQASWSDLPIIVTRRAGEDSQETRLAMTALGNVILLERPMRVTTMVSTVRSALRSRERQYETREYLAELERRTEEIGALNAQLEARVFARTKELEESNRILTERTEDLVQINAQLERFAYISSHDLQEPLRTVAGYVQLIAKRYKGRLDRDADDFIYYALDGTHRMQNLIRDLLKYSCVGPGQMKSELVDCNAVLDQALTSIKMAIEEANAEVTSDSLPMVRGDPTQLGLVFQNLVANALKFRREQPPCTHISAERKGGEWVFSVTDNGIGIEPQYLDRIFAIFQRLHTHEEYSGTGIGLAICKRIIDAHCGRMWVESALGKGSIFYFSLPCLQTTHEDSTSSHAESLPIADLNG